MKPLSEVKIAVLFRYLDFLQLKQIKLLNPYHMIGRVNLIRKEIEHRAFLRSL